MTATTTVTVRSNSPLRIACELSDADFWFMPWWTESCRVIKKDIGVKFSGGNTPQGGTYITHPWHLITVKTSDGEATIAVAKDAYTCILLGDRLPIQIRRSRWYTDRFQARLIRMDKDQPFAPFTKR